MSDKILVPGDIVKLLEMRIFYTENFQHDRLLVGSMLVVISHNTSNGKLTFLSTRGYGYIWETMILRVFEKLN